ncbi:MAG: CPBP family intramembrane glutamic endopeptidase [Candidatus Saccharimonadales bacterium]
MIKTARANDHGPLYQPLAAILLTVAIFLVPQFIAVILVGAYPAVKGWSEEVSLSWLTDSTAAQFFVMLIVGALATTAVLRLLRRVQAPPARIGLVRPRLRDAGYAAAAYVFYFGSYIVILTIATQLFPGLNAGQEQDIGFKHVTSQLHTLMAFLSLVILPPLWEEIVFRGFLFTNLRVHLRLRWAALLTGLLFAAVHLQAGNGKPLLWVAALDTFVLSCYLCYLREKTGSLVAPMLLHAAKNFIAFYYLFLR